MTHAEILDQLGRKRDEWLKKTATPTTLHNMVVLREVTGGMYPVGFMWLLRSVLDQCNCAEEDVESDLGGQRIVPDYIGVVLDEWGGFEITAYEVEDSHPLAMEKMMRYAVIWSVLDYYDPGTYTGGTTFNVVPVDRHGAIGEPARLVDFYYLDLQNAI